MFNDLAKLFYWLLRFWFEFDIIDDVHHFLWAFPELILNGSDDA